MFLAEDGTDAARAAGPADSEAGLRRILAKVLGVPVWDVPLGRDELGRPRLEGLRVGLAVCRDEGTIVLALAPNASIAMSVGRVPEAQGDLLCLLAFSEAERRWAEQAPRDGYHRRLARLWARKEAVLRLAGLPLVAAPDVDVLAGGQGGAVALPALTGRASPASGGALEAAYVRDLAAAPGLAAAVATSAPVHGVYTWLLSAPADVAV